MMVVFACRAVCKKTHEAASAGSASPSRISVNTNSRIFNTRCTSIVCYSIKVTRRRGRLFRSPTSPSIAVLPFQNMSGDPEQEYFADGIVEDIITGLSRFRWLFVIARNSSFTYKGRAVDVKQVGRELGVRYLLEGSVRKSINRVRIAGQLIDVSSGTHLWADRFEGAIEDVFELQDQVTASVVGAIAPRLQQAEIERARRKPTEILDAYDLVLRGLANVYKRTREGNDEALSLFYQAIERDPDYAWAYALAARCFSRRKAFGWVFDQEQEVAEARRLALRAVQFGKDDATALFSAGYVLAYVARELDDGAAFLDRALSLNPNLAMAWSASGWVKVYLGEPDRALERFAHAMRLSPVDPFLFGMQQGSAYAHFFAGRWRPRTWCRRRGGGVARKEARRADRRATPVMPFPQGVHSGAGEVECHGPNSLLVRVARLERNQENRIHDHRQSGNEGAA